MLRAQHNLAGWGRSLCSQRGLRMGWRPIWGSKFALARNNILPPDKKTAAPEQLAAPRAVYQAATWCSAVCTLGKAASNKVQPPKPLPGSCRQNNWAHSPHQRAGCQEVPVPSLLCEEGRAEQDLERHVKVRRVACGPRGSASPRAVLTKPAPSLPNANTILRGTTERRIWMKEL